MLLSFAGVMALLSADQNLLAPNVRGPGWSVEGLATGCVGCLRAHVLHTRAPLARARAQLTAAARDFGLNDMERDTYL
jgi:hypothetical protein